MGHSSLVSTQNRLDGRNGSSLATFRTFWTRKRLLMLAVAIITLLVILFILLIFPVLPAECAFKRYSDPPVIKSIIGDKLLFEAYLQSTGIESPGDSFMPVRATSVLAFTNEDEMRTGIKLKITCGVLIRNESHVYVEYSRRDFKYRHYCNPGQIGFDEQNPITKFEYQGISHEFYNMKADTYICLNDDGDTQLVIK